MRNKRFIFLIMVSVIILSVAYFLIWTKEDNERKNTNGDVFVIDNPKADGKDISMENVISNGEEDTFVAETKANIYVYVCGNVVSPGVYLLAEGDRMFMAIDKAGGITDDGCVDYLELALELCDGQRIYVPDYEEAITISQMNNDSDNGLVNLNRASIEELMTLPGIGEAKAKAIVSYREQQPFASIEDIMNIPGIKEAAFSKIQDYICV